MTTKNNKIHVYIGDRSNNRLAAVWLEYDSNN